MSATPSLSAQLTELRDASRNNLPEATHNAMMNATQALRDSGIVSNAPKQGDTLLAFDLPNQNGEQRDLATLLKQGPVVLTFYRGGWCPYCNLELKAYQHVLADIRDADATLVAITPELPDASLTTAEKNELEFEVLTDQNADYARKLGLVFTLPEVLRPIYSSFGIEVEEHNGTGQFDFPLAATFIIASDGVITSAFVDADYTQRKEPSEIVAELQTLK